MESCRLRAESHQHKIEVKYKGVPNNQLAGGKGSKGTKESAGKLKFGLCKEHGCAGGDRHVLQLREKGVRERPPIFRFIRRKTAD